LPGVGVGAIVTATGAASTIVIEEGVMNSIDIAMMSSNVIHDCNDDDVTNLRLLLVVAGDDGVLVVTSVCENSDDDNGSTYT
jgi:hypothetical protein